jgi:alkane 1-monooxygenase
MKPLKYLFTFVPAAAVWVSLTQTGWLTWFGTLFVFGFIPLLEWVMGVKQAKINASPENQLLLSEIIGRIFAMGILCGSFGINVAHELGHRSNKTEQFFIEHNRGYHKSVTPE